MSPFSSGRCRSGSLKPVMVAGLMRAWRRSQVIFKNNFKFVYQELVPKTEFKTMAQICLPDGQSPKYVPRSIEKLDIDKILRQQLNLAISKF